MKFKAKYASSYVDFLTGKLLVTFHILDKDNNITHVDKLNQNKDKELCLEIKNARKKRSLDANAMLWACIGDIAEVLRCDNEEVYLNLLESYGQYTYIEIRKDALDKFKEGWRTCKEVGSRDIDGVEYVELLCCFGSSTYDTKEFSILLDGCISEMRRLGLQVPAGKDIERSLELWQR